MRSIKFQGFRGLNDLEISDLRTVNLIVGKNNVGKTSILEGIQILRSESPIAVMSTVARRRMETRFIQDDRRQRYTNLWSSANFFYGHKIGPESQYSISSESESHVASYSELLTSQMELEYDSRDLDSDDKFIKLEHRGSDFRIRIDSDGFVRDDQRLPRTTVRPTLITEQSLNRFEMSSLYSNVIFSGTEEELLSALRILDNRVERLFVIPSMNQYSDVVADFILDLSGVGRIPLGSMGDGMRRILSLAMSLPAAEGECLLVDEIDTGLHHSAMASMWRMVIGLCESKGIQIFATTHSLDCLKSLSDATSDNLLWQNSVAVHRVREGQRKATTFSGLELELAMKTETELR